MFWPFRFPHIFVVEAKHDAGVTGEYRVSYTGLAGLKEGLSECVTRVLGVYCRFPMKS